MIKLIECPNCHEKTSINTENKLTKEELITLHYGYCFCCQDIVFKNKKKEETECLKEKTI